MNAARRYLVEWHVKRSVDAKPCSVIVAAYDARDAAFQAGEPMGRFKSDGYPRLWSVDPCDDDDRAQLTEEENLACKTAFVGASAETSELLAIIERLTSPIGRSLKTKDAPPPDVETSGAPMDRSPIRTHHTHVIDGGDCGALDFDQTAELAETFGREAQFDPTATARERSLAAAVLMLCEERRQRGTFADKIEDLERSLDSVEQSLKTGRGR